MKIKDYIINNLKDCNNEELKETIVSSINSNDEVVLPGLGVLFEIYWKNCNDMEKSNLLNILVKHIN